VSLAAALFVTAAAAVAGPLMLMLAVTRTDTGPAASTLVSTATTLESGDSTTTAPSTTVVEPASATSIVSTLTDVSDIAAVAVASVVRVEMTVSFRGRERVAASGSGVIVDTGTIVTNAHVVGTGTGVSVTLNDGSTHPGTLVGVDTDHDLAVISIDSTDLTPVKFGSTEDLLVGDPAIAIGYPLGLEGGPSVSTGIVSAKGRTITDSTASLSGIIQTDAAITEGSSGGALLDAQGSLVGITTAVGVSSVGIEGIGFAIPIETIEQVLPELLATG